MKDLRTQMIRVGDKYSFDGPTIVYCPTKKSAEEVCTLLKRTYYYDA